MARGAYRGADQHVVVPVLQTILVKEIRNPPPLEDCDMEIIATIVQRCVLPEGASSLQFQYRFNDTVVPLDKHQRKRRVAPAQDDPSVRADCATYAVHLPLRISDDILNTYPFSIQFAKCDIELTSCVIDDGDATNGNLTYRPNLQRATEEPLKTMLMIAKPSKLCRHRVYALGSRVPVVFAKTERKE